MSRLLAFVCLVWASIVSSAHAQGAEPFRFLACQTPSALTATLDNYTSLQQPLELDAAPLVTGCVYTSLSSDPQRYTYRDYWYNVDANGLFYEVSRVVLYRGGTRVNLWIMDKAYEIAEFNDRPTMRFGPGACIRVEGRLGCVSNSAITYSTEYVRTEVLWGEEPS